MEDSYPLNRKKIFIAGTEYSLREIPARYIISVENEEVVDGLIPTCEAGSNVPYEVLVELSTTQLKAMYDDVMVLSYGKDWQKRTEKSDPSKKK